MPMNDLGWDEDGMCDDHGAFACKRCALRSAERKEPVEVGGLVRGLRERAREASAHSWWSKLEETTEWRAADALAARDATIAALKRELGEAREVLERCATIVERNLYHQHEKIEDVPKIARAFLARQEMNDDPA